jgi:hypothetical protein
MSTVEVVAEDNVKLSNCWNALSMALRTDILHSPCPGPKLQACFGPLVPLVQCLHTIIVSVIHDFIFEQNGTLTQLSCAAMN